jgi:hypothetical protein
VMLAGVVGEQVIGFDKMTSRNRPEPDGSVCLMVTLLVLGLVGSSIAT